MKFPKKLEKGNTIALVCTSSGVETERIAECVKAMEDLGYKVKTAGYLDVHYAG